MLKLWQHAVVLHLCHVLLNTLCLFRGFIWSHHRSAVMLSIVARPSWSSTSSCHCTRMHGCCSLQIYSVKN